MDIPATRPFRVFILATLCLVLLQLTPQLVAQGSDPGEKQAGPRVENNLERFTGTYATHAGSNREVVIAISDDHLTARSPGGGGKLIRHEGSTFRFETGRQELTFAPDPQNPDGDIDRFLLGPHGASASGQVFRRTALLEADYHATAGQLRPHALSDAVIMGDVESARVLIASGVDVEELDSRRQIAGSNGRRPLNWAALHNRVEMIEMLLEAGADIDNTNLSKLTPLHHAAEAGSLEAAEILIARGANLDAETARGQTPLAIALRRPRSGVADRVQAALSARDCDSGDCPASDGEPAYQSPADLDDGLTTASLEDVDADAASIHRLLGNLARGDYEQVDGLLILKDGKLVVEQYYNQWTVDRPHPMQSVSKGITALLIGSALKQGHIDSLQDPISRYLPDYTSELEGSRAAITLQHLLTMSAGFDWNEQDPPYGHPDNIRGHEVLSEDSVRYTLTRPHINQPGEVFTYSGGYVTVAGAILAKAAEADSVLDYLGNSTLSELGLEGLQWHSQRDGRQNTAGGLFLRPRDLAKIGQMVLDGGTWKGKRVLDQQFLSEALSAQIPTPGAWNEYGYYWWGRTFETSDGHRYAADAALGWGGQELILVKELGLVVVFTATNYQIPTPTASIMTDVILPAFE